MFEPGDMIIPMSYPFLKVLNQCGKGNFCDNCLKPGATLRCGSCAKMHYCSKSCQKADWDEGHSLECQSPIFKDPDTVFGKRKVKGALTKQETLQILRTLAKYHLKPNSFEEIHPVYGSMERSFNDILSKTQDKLHPVPKNEDIVFTTLFQKLKKDHSFRTVDFDENFLQTIWAVWRSNPFELMNETGVKVIGDGLYVAHSALRHSCRPNACQVIGSEPGLLEIRCVHPIAEGQDPTISYLDSGSAWVTEMNLNKNERQEHLEIWYGFTCNCELCMAEKNRPLINYAKLRNLNRKLSLASSSRMDYSAIEKIREEGLQLLRKLYHENDRRITDFMLRALTELHNCQAVPLAKHRKAAKNLEKRLKINFEEGIESYDWFLQMMEDMSQQREKKLVGKVPQKTPTAAKTGKGDAEPLDEQYDEYYVNENLVCHEEEE